MGKGIVTDNSDNRFLDTTVIVDSSSIGIHSLNDDRSEFERTTVLVGQEIDIELLIRQLNLPAGVPPDYVREAVELVKGAKEPEPLRFSKLRTWLMERDFGVKFVAETLVTFTAAVLGAKI